MNSITDTSSSVSKRSTSPRPTTDGEEEKKFHDTSHPISEPYKNWNVECNSLCKTSCGETVDQSFTQMENVTDSAYCTLNSRNSSPPASYKWEQSLHCLLGDVQGVALFQKFLQQEGQDTRCLDFWFASRGVKKNDPNDREGFVKLIKVVFEKKLKRISAISDETKEEIRQKLASNTDVDDTIFDKAKREVEAYMMKITYPNFLRSDLYIQHLGGWQNELSPEKERVVSPEPVDQLPTVHKDAELHIPSKISLTNNNSLQRNRASYVPKYKSEEPVGDNPVHNRPKHKEPPKVLEPTIAVLNKDELNSPIPRTEPESVKPKTQQNFNAKVVKKLNEFIGNHKKTEIVNEKLKVVETSVSSKPDGAPSHVTRQRHKSNTNAVVYPEFFVSQPEENLDYILDEHISRVFKDPGHHTPASDCLSPLVPRQSGGDIPGKSRVPRSSGNNKLPEFIAASHKHHQTSPYTGSNNIKYRRDHNTYPTDSAMYDCKSDDIPSNYKSQYSSLANTGSEPIDHSRRIKEHSRRCVSKKFSSVSDPSSSYFDSGINPACESVPTYSKVTQWLKRMLEQGREQRAGDHHSSTSPVLNQSNFLRKTGYNSNRDGSQDARCSQWSGAAPPKYSQDYSSQRFSGPEAQKRVEDDKAKMRLKKPAKKSLSLNAIETATTNNPPSNDVTVIGYSYGRHAVPFLSTYPAKPITLRQFKSKLAKKGNFRYFFKTACHDFGTGVIFEEVTEDSKVLPLWEGKVFCVIESMD